MPYAQQPCFLQHIAGAFVATGMFNRFSFHECSTDLSMNAALTLNDENEVRVRPLADARGSVWTVTEPRH